MKTVGELREELIASGQYTPEEAKAVKGKDNLIEAVESLKFYIDEIDECEFIPPEENEPNEEAKNIAPEYCSDEWPDYAITFFNETELDNGRPKIDGLRRVAELLLGEIVYSGPRDCRASEGSAYVRWEITFLWRMSAPSAYDFNRDDFPMRTFGACADATYENTSHPYNNYLMAMADTRAEARALKKALRLSVIAADEVAQDDAIETDEKMKGTQEAMINRACNRLEVNPADVYEYLGFEGALSYNDAATILRTLRGFTDNPETIPEQLKKEK